LLEILKKTTKTLIRDGQVRYLDPEHSEYKQEFYPFDSYKMDEMRDYMVSM
jgi:hypothetical protein